MEHRKYSSDELEKALETSMLSFPEKLWELVNDPTCNEIEWNYDGKSLLIPNIQNFITEILNNPSKPIFKTKNFASFVRQLNLYGFRKISTQSRKPNPGTTVCPSKCQFKHPCFVKGKRELLQEVSRRYQSTRSHDILSAREADLVHAGRVFPVGMLPLMNPFQPWPSPPLFTSYHDQLSPSGYPPQRQHSGYAQSELQQLIGPLLPLYGYQPECSNSVMRSQFLDRQRYQLLGACAGQTLNCSVDGLDNYARHANCSRGQNLARGVYSNRGQDLPREYRAMSAPTERVRDHNSELRPTVVVINNTPQVPLGACAASPSQLDESVKRVSQGSRSSLSKSQDFKYSQAGTELGSNNSACHYNGNTSRDQSCPKELHSTERTEV